MGIFLAAVIPKRGARSPGCMVAALLVLATFCAVGRQLPAEQQLPADEDVTTSSATLHWRNGDVQSGQLLGAEGHLLQWQSPLFASPLSLDVAHLQAVEIPRPAKAAAPSDPIQFVLRNRDTLYGSLVEMTDQHLVLDSARHGRCRLLRSALRSFQRLQAPTFVYQGPQGTDGWKTVTKDRTLSQWQTGPEGQLVTDQFGAELFRPLEVASEADMELWIQWTKGPGFVIGLATAERGRLAMEDVKLETWGNDLVLQALDTQGDFTRIGALDPENAGSLRIRLLWERPLGQMSLYSLEGELLAQLATGKPGNDNTGLYILNKGADLTVTRVRISQTRQPVPADLAEGQALVHLADDSRLQGSLDGFDGQDQTLRITGTDGQQHRLAVDRIAGVFLAQDQQEPSAAARTQVAFYDGTLLRGTLLAIGDGKLSLETGYTGEPLVSELGGIRQLKFLATDEDVADQEASHVLEYREGTLRGNLGPSNIDGLPLAWRPLGAIHPAPLRQQELTRIVLDEQRSPSQRDREAQLPGTLYLTNGDVLPCRIEAVDADHVRGETPLVEARCIPRARVKAMELGSQGEQPDRGFGDNQWEQVQAAAGAVQQTENQAVFHQPATLRHKSLRGYQRMRFTVHWQKENAARLTIAPDREEDADGQQRVDHVIMLSFYDAIVQAQGTVLARQRGLHGQAAGAFGGAARVQVRPMVAKGQMGGMAGMGMARQPLAANQVVPAVVEGNQCKAEVTLTVEDETLKVLVNGKHAFSQPFAEQQASRGLITLAVQHLRQVPENNLLTLSDFQADASLVSLRTLSLGQDQARGVLTVPRHRRDNPPTHVLVAKNGDLLRGRLTGVDATDVHFVSRLTDIRMPRERLVGIIRLDPLEDTQPLPETAGDGRVHTLLDDGSAIRFTPQQVVDSRLVGHSEILGRCEIPLDALRWLNFDGPGNASSRLLFAHWKLRPATEPQFAGPPGGEQGEASPPGAGSPLVGTVAKDFSTKLLDGRPFRLRAHSDQIVVLDFWATWCGPCIQAMPALIEVVSEFPQDQVRLVAVNQKENAQTIEQFLKNRQWELTVALDPDGEIGGQFQVRAIPQTVIIAPGGRIHRLHVGAHAGFPAELRNTLKELVAPAR